MKKIFIALMVFLTTATAKADFLDDLHKRFPLTQGAKVEKAFGNFYSIYVPPITTFKGTSAPELLFINEDMSILINGEVIDLNKNTSMTAAIREANRPKVSNADLPLKDAIKLGSGPDTIYVFSDPDCPYCKQLEREFDKLQGITIYIFPFPLVSLHPNAATMAESIWCSKDRAAAWHNYVFKQVKPALASCDNPIQRNLALGEKYQLMGTPAIVLSNGTVIPGYIPAARIMAEIAKAKQQ